MNIEFLRPEFVDTFPATLESGVLYVSIEFCTCAHLCACGCGEEVITPLSPARWAITYNGKDVSLRPSVGNWTLPCRSHYVLVDGHIRWARNSSQREIALNRARDKLAVKTEVVADIHDEDTGRPNTFLDRLEGSSANGIPRCRLRRWLRSHS